MLAGLIFAVQNAEQETGLTATCAFGGSTLIEHQARLLVGAGVAQIVVVVGRVTPALLGATARIGRRVPVDVVRSAVGAVEKLHPLARIIVVADGLVPSPAMIAFVAGEPRDALLVTDAAGASLERIAAATCWAGLAAIGTQRLARVAEMPSDYDFQSTLLRAAVESQATQLFIPEPIVADRSHAVERDARRLAERGHAVAAATIPAAERWADRLMSAALLRLARYPVAARLEPFAVAIAGAVIGLAGTAAVVSGFPISGLVFVIIALGALAFGSGLAWLRDDDRPDRIRAWGGGTLVISTIIAFGYLTDHGPGLAERRWSASALPMAMPPGSASTLPMGMPPGSASTLPMGMPPGSVSTLPMGMPPGSASTLPMGMPPGSASTLPMGMLPGVGMLAALVAVAFGVLLERAVGGRLQQRWWASPAAYPIILVPTAARAPYLGLLLVAAYAMVTLAAVVEGLRKRP